VKCLKAALPERLSGVWEVRLGAAISEPLDKELPNRSEARTTGFILIEPPTDCKLEVGRHDRSLFCSAFSVVFADVSFAYAALAGEARPTAVRSAASLVGDDCTVKLRAATAKPPREKKPTGWPKTVAVTESVK